SQQELDLAARLAQGSGDDRRRAAFVLLRARAACPDDGRAGARLLRMAQEEGWFLSGPPSPSLLAHVDAIARAPYDGEPLNALWREALDEGRFLHAAAALVRLAVLHPDDGEVERALAELTGDPGAPYG